MSKLVYLYQSNGPFFYGVCGDIAVEVSGSRSKFSDDAEWLASRGDEDVDFRGDYRRVDDTSLFRADDGAEIDVEDPDMDGLKLVALYDIEARIQQVGPTGGLKEPNYVVREYLGITESE